MKIRQYAYFYVQSSVVDPGQINQQLPVAPTRVSWRGSRSSVPLIPRYHSCFYDATGDGRVDDLIRELVDRFEPFAEQLQMLAASNTQCGISIVRRFDDPNGVEEEFPTEGIPEDLVKMAGQHHLLGFHLDAELLSRLVALGWSLDADEYG
jgi:Domain of unknown function (DUF4279)